MATTRNDTKPTWRDILGALRRRKTGAMFALGFAAGLPYVLITGTLLAWFTNEGIEVKTIGVFSWVILIYSFKFLWAPGVDRMPAPRVFNMGHRRAGILAMQGVIIAMLAVISLASPQTQLGWIALAAVLCTVASTSQDILIDAWRIEVADEVTTVDLLAATYQIGYRLATVLGGAGALIIAHRVGWNDTFVVLSGLMALAVIGVFIAEDGPVLRKTFALDADAPAMRLRNLAIAPVLLGLVWSFWSLFSFMAYALQAPEAANARAFTRETGPWIVFVSVVFPFMAAALVLRAQARTRGADPVDSGPGPQGSVWPAQSFLDVMYGFVLAPIADIVKRLRYGAVFALLIAVTYRFVDLIWGGIAYPFYLGENYGALGHSLDEVAIASKLFGVLMTFVGIALGGMAILRIGRMPCLFFGAIIAAATNLLYADLAEGGAGTHAFLSATHLYGVFGAFQPLATFLGLDVEVGDKLSRLMAVIAAENFALGFASAAIVVYLSSIVNPKYAAVQYALLASLSMLVGSLGRGALGELVEERGFAFVFYLTAALGLIAIVITGIEWIRQSRVKGAAAQARAPASA